MRDTYTLPDDLANRRDATLEALDRQTIKVLLAARRAQEVIDKEHQKLKRQVAAFNKLSREAYALNQDTYWDIYRKTGVEFTSRLAETHRQLVIDHPIVNSPDLVDGLRIPSNLLGVIPRDVFEELPRRLEDQTLYAEIISNGRE